MYRDEPQIKTELEALDELTDVRMTLKGLASLTLALADSGMYEPEAIRLTSCLLNYCEITTEAISSRFGRASRAIQPSRSS